MFTIKNLLRAKAFGWI